MRTRLPQLECGTLRVQLAPHIGGSIARFYSELGRGRRWHWLRPASVAALCGNDARAMASFPLLPFCNRLRHGRAVHGAQAIAVAPHPSTIPHALHGLGWQRPWHLERGGARQAWMTLRHGGGDGWPWPFEAQQDIRLDEGGLWLDLGLRNLGDAPMPVGLGHHPYLPRRRGTRLSADLTGMWATDAQCLPTTLEQPPLLDQLVQGRQLQGLFLDNNFHGWKGAARIDWPAGGRWPAATLTLRASEPLNLLALYVPARTDWFCVEPVSNCTDWLNLNGYPKAVTGGAELAPGASLHSVLRLAVTSF